MQIFNVNELKPHPQNDYYFDDIQGDNWKEFKKSIETSGVIEPIVITQEKMIVSGHQRVRACKELGIEDIGCRIKLYDKGDTEKEVLKDLIETNLRQRGIGNTNPIKLGACIRFLEDYYGIKHGGSTVKNENVDYKVNLNRSDLSDLIGLNVKTIERLVRLNKLIPEIQDLISSDKISWSSGSRFWARLSKEEQLKFFELLGEHRVVSMTQKQLEKEFGKINKPSDSDSIIEFTDDFTNLLHKYEQSHNKISPETLGGNIKEDFIKTIDKTIKFMSSLKSRVGKGCL